MLLSNTIGQQNQGITSGPVDQQVVFDSGLRGLILAPAHSQAQRVDVMGGYHTDDAAFDHNSGQPIVIRFGSSASMFIQSSPSNCSRSPPSSPLALGSPMAFSRVGSLLERPPRLVVRLLRRGSARFGTMVARLLFIPLQAGVESLTGFWKSREPSKFDAEGVPPERGRWDRYRSCQWIADSLGTRLFYGRCFRAVSATD